MTIIHQLIPIYGGWIGMIQSGDHVVDIVGDSEMKAPLHWTLLRIVVDDDYIEGGLVLSTSIDPDPYDVDEQERLKITGVDAVDY